jgi:hypothetical protein
MLLPSTSQLIISSVTYHGNLICEERPLPIFDQWDAPPLPVDEAMAMPESPLFCPRGEFFAVVHDPACSGLTYDLICDMRDITELFITHDATLDHMFDKEGHAYNAQPWPSSTEFEAKLTEVRAKVASLPSARIPGLPTTNDWVYEACRIAAIIYVSAIIMRVPLSVAANPNRNIVTRDLVSFTGSLESTTVFVPRLTETLYEVIEKTNTGDVWNNMSGVFYWVTAVGAAAARTPMNIDMYSRPSSANEAYSTWVRRCLIMFSSRAMILFLFEHPIPLLHMEKKLLRVQELLARGSVTTLLS